MIDIKGDVDRWKCVYKECGAKCCKPAKVTIGDLKRISKELGVPSEEFAETEDERGLFQLKSKNGSCFFSHDDHSCELHKRKVVPLSCKMFPFLFDGITYSDDIILTLKTAEECPGYGKGEELGEDFKEKLEQRGAQFTREVEQYLNLKRKGKSLKEILDKFE